MAIDLFIFRRTHVLSEASIFTYLYGILCSASVLDEHMTERGRVDSPLIWYQLQRGTKQ